MLYNAIIGNVIDLHIHSEYSDGTDSIEEILAKAKSLALNQISITDHNTLDGSIVASKIANINYVVGTELSVGYNGSEVHLLAYFPNGSATEYKNVNFVIKTGEVYKKLAIMEMIENLNEMGYDIKIKELSEFTKGVINRVHICKALMKHGYISSVEEGFRNIIGDDCPAYVERKTVTISEAVQAIHDDGGIAVIAHPYEYDSLNIDKFLQDISSIIDGIECLHPSANSEQSKHLIDLAKKYKLRITGGSDYHGDNKPDIAMGMMNVPNDLIINK